MDNQTIIEIENLLDIQISDQKYHFVDSNRYGGIPITIPKTLVELTIEENVIVRKIVTFCEKGIIDIQTKERMLNALHSLYGQMKQKADEVSDMEKPQYVDFLKLQLSETMKRMEVDEILEKQEKGKIR